MQDLVLAACAVFLFTSSALVTLGSCEINHEERSLDNYSKRRQPAAIWFGPRLGRKKRTHGEDGYKMVPLDADETENFVNGIQDYPWALLALHDSKRQISFTPRLGRESSGDFLREPEGTDRWPHDPDTPELGRHIIQFTPRLGRDSS